MYDNETVRAECEDYELFIKAFYLFLERNPSPPHAAARLKTGRDGAAPEVVLWSGEAADQFRSFAAEFKQQRDRSQSFRRFDGPRP